MDRPSDSGEGAELEYGDYYRQHSLWARQAADSQTRLIGLFDMMAERGAAYSADMCADAVRMRQTMGQVADVMAAGPRLRRDDGRLRTGQFPSLGRVRGDDSVS